jgi:hypothetical protein
MLKRCSHCRIDKPLAEFPGDRGRPDGLDLQCRACVCERARRKRARYIARGCCADCGQPRGDLTRRWYCAACAIKHGGTIAHRQIRLLVLQAYSQEEPSCACCGESILAFLTLDHINGGGRAHRSQYSGTLGVYREVKRFGFPVGYQVLCFNCNLARGFYVTCPHETPGAPAQLAIRPGREAREIVDGRRCTRCTQNLPAVAFYADKGGPGGLQSRCRICTREASTERLRAARREGLAHYSDGELQCQCCGECEEMFLALDHIAGKGPRQPGGRSGGNTFYAWLRKQGYPMGIRVLCHNCNCAMGRDRVCPHVLVGTTVEIGRREVTRVRRSIVNA